MSVVGAVCFQVEVCATVRFTVQRTPTVRACVRACVSLSVIPCSSDSLHLQ